MIDRPTRPAATGGPWAGSVLEHAPIALLVCDMSGVCRQANQRAVALFRSTEIVGSPLDQWLRRSLDWGTSDRGWLAIPLAGSPTPVTVAESTFAGEGDDNRERYRVITLIESAPSASPPSDQERLHQAVRVAEIGIFDQDHRADTLYWSPLLREMLGRKPGDPPASTDEFFATIHPEDRARVRGELTAAMNPDGAGSWNSDFRVVWPCGAIRHHRARARTFFERRHGELEPVRTVGAVRDRTEEQRAADERLGLQQRLGHTQRLESLGRLAGGIAHDFNNALSVIQGISELMLATESLAPRTRRDIEQIQQAGERSALLTRQLLTYANRGGDRPTLVNLNDTLQSMASLLRRLLGANIELRAALADDLWRVRIDPGLASQVLIHLLVNARDAIAKNGVVRLETGNLSLRGDSGPEEFVQVTVRDDGCGIDPDHIDEIFDPFFSTKTDGVGLGLSVVYGAVTQGGGRIEVDSEPGEGTEFRVLLPRARRSAEQGQQPAPPADETSLRRGATILLCEDDPLVLELERTQLEAAGLQVIATLEPHEALREVRRRGSGIDLLVTDVVLPSMSGPELVDHAAEYAPGVPALFVSGHAPGILAQHGLDERAAPFLQKPFSHRELLQSVARQLTRSDSV